MAERFCLRCDWAGETGDPACPRCAAPLYRMSRSERPTPPDLPPARHQPPADVQSTRGASLEVSERERDGDEADLPSAGAVGRGRWRVIALALTLTAVVAFALPRGGGLDAGGGDQTHTDPEAPADLASPSLATNPSTSPPPCSGDATTPAAPQPARTVPAATADYYFQGSLESSLGTAPDLSEVAKGNSAFTADERTGVTVLGFAGGGGLELAPTTRVIPSSGYSIEVLFRLDRLAGFRKIIDFRGGSTDDGLYMQDGCLIFFPKGQEGLTRIGSDSFVQVVITRDADDRVVGYVDGVRQFAFHDWSGLAKVGGSDSLRFFVDDVTTTEEWSSGTVSQIRLFDQALTPNEVALLACTELAIGDPTFPCHALER